MEVKNVMYELSFTKHLTIHQDSMRAAVKVGFIVNPESSTKIVLDTEEKWSEYWTEMACRLDQLKWGELWKFRDERKAWTMVKAMREGEFDWTMAGPTGPIFTIRFKPEQVRISSECWKNPASITGAPDEPTDRDKVDSRLIYHHLMQQLPEQGGETHMYMNRLVFSGGLDVASYQRHMGKIVLREVGVPHSTYVYKEV